jgi:HTH-type transcriptional regulator / antitoxin MqsA
VAKSNARTRIHPETGAALRRRQRDYDVVYKDLQQTVKLKGWFPVDDGDGILSREDAKPIDAALAEMKKIYAERVRAFSVSVRKIAKLNQEEASRLLTGSRNSFHKYERGKAAPSYPTLVLMKLIQDEPALVQRIRKQMRTPA